MEIKVWMVIVALVYVMWTFVAYRRFKKTDDLFDNIVLSWISSHVLILCIAFWAILDSVMLLLVDNPDINVFDFTIFKI